jgi:hypothetical protein
MERRALLLAWILSAGSLSAGSSLHFYRDPDSNVFWAANGPVRAQFEGNRPRATLVAGGETLYLEVAGARHAAPELYGPPVSRLNLLLGNEANQWRTGIPLHSAIVYRGVYPGIDLVWTGGGSSLKSDFRVAPGADPSRVQLLYSGFQQMSLDAEGALLLRTSSGELREKAPVCWSEAANGNIPVDCAYRLLGNGLVAFTLGNYDASLPLVLDPIFNFATYLGGSGVDSATAVVVDGSGNAYVAGFTESVNFPVAGAIAPNRGGVDAFVLKMSSSGTQLIYATYLGGRGEERALGLAVDDSGNAYVTGFTNSTDFPTVNGIRTVLSGGRDAFVAKLSGDGSQILWSTLWGGTGSENGNAIAVDGSANATIAGDTTSTDLPLQSALRTTNAGGTDAFLTKFNAVGALVFSTYLGGSGEDRATAIAADSTGDLYVAGGTTSPNFPAVTAFRSTNAGGQDCFVAKLATSGASLVYSTYLGGSGGSVGAAEQCHAIAVDSNRNAYVAGITSSANFPLLGAFQTAHGGGATDGFVTKLGTTGSSLVYSSYYGTIASDYLNALAVDAAGQAHVAGRTTGNTLPLIDAIQSTPGGSTEVYFARVKPAGNQLDFSSYYGGNGGDSPNAIAVNSTGRVWVAGTTSSTNLPLTSAYQSFGGAEGHAFVISVALSPPTIPSQAPSTGPSASPSSSIEMRQRWTFQLSDPNGFQDISIVSVVIAATASTAQPTCHLYYNQYSNLFYLYNDSNVSTGPLAPGSGGTLENSQCKFYAATSSAIGNVNGLTLTVDLERKSTFYGAKNVYVWLNDRANLAAGLDSKALWNITGQNLAPTTGPAASPSSVSTARQVITVAPTDANGFSDLAIVSVVVSSSAAAPPGTCHAYYNRLTNRLYLLGDANQTLGPITPGTATVLQNSQCILYGQTSTVSGAGSTLTLNLDLEMLAAYSGVRGIYVWANDQLNAATALEQKGTWNIPAAPNVVPSTGPNASPGFIQSSTTRSVVRFVPSDGNGFQDIRIVSIVLNTDARVVPNSCHVYLNRLTGLFYLYSDTNQPLGPATPGSSTILENSQCRFHAATSLVSGSGNNLTIDVDIERKPSYSGTKGLFLWLNDSKNASTALDAKGIWN